MLSHTCTPDTTAIEELAEVVARGGPVADEYTAVAGLFAQLHQTAHTAQIARVFEPTLVQECIHGWAYLKPYGYSGDHVIIDRIHTQWVSDEPHLQSWDRFCQAQPAAKAVRNRKQLFLSLLHALDDTPRNEISVLNVGSGPCRDVVEFLQTARRPTVGITCVDNDPRAIAYASALCKPFDHNVTFHRANALRFRPAQRFNLIWCAGLCDYFDDDQFARVGRRLYSHLAPEGELIIGNFNDTNPSRGLMELLLDWHLHHRSAARLRHLATLIGVPDHLAIVVPEPEGVNLFLKMKAGPTLGNSRGMSVK
jgi:SAM-dependent methyltransferase